MKDYKYKSKLEVDEAFNNLNGNVKNSGLFDCHVSYSFRVYNKVGNTIEFHVYYK